MPKPNQTFTESAPLATSPSRRALNILVIHDARPGHLTQLQGLTQRLSAHCCVHITWMAANKHKIKLRQLFQHNKLFKPDGIDIVIGAGHSTHKALIFVTRQNHAVSVLLMKPSLPTSMFDFIICPKHDGLRESKRILNTLGTLNKVEPGTSPESYRNEHLMLIGGPSKHFNWQQNKLINEIKTVCDQNSDINWQLSDSPRTPADFMHTLKKLAIPNLKCHHYRDDSFEELSIALPNSAMTWVTADSMSMLYEAITSGSPTAVFNLTPSNLKRPSRIASHIHQLIEEHTISSFEQWQRQPDTSLPSKKLWEADRAALWLLEKYQDYSSVKKYD